MGCGGSKSTSNASAPAAAPSATALAASLGVIRLKQHEKPAPGEVDSPESFNYNVTYRVVPGLTRDMCQTGKLTDAVESDFLKAIDELHAQGVSGITSDSGLMMHFQHEARKHTTKPVFMSSLAQLPAVTCAYNKDELIAIITASSNHLEPMRELIKKECGVDPSEKRFLIVGCEDVPGYEAGVRGSDVDVEKLSAGIVAKAQKLLTDQPNVRAFLVESADLPPCSDAIRKATGLPVYDAITACDYFVSGVQDNKRFGINNWQQQNAKAPPQAAPAAGQDAKKAASLGVIRLDYDYPPAPGDMDHPDSFNYDVFYRVVPGLTFEMCQSGKMTPQVESAYVQAIEWLKEKNVSGITGDCGFMMYFQHLAREHTTKPVFMSALAQLPAVTCAYNKDELIAIFTANGKTLEPMRDIIKQECGVDPEEKRFLMVGCEDVPGFEAVAEGKKVDVEKVTPGIVAKAKKVIAEHPNVRAILMECTELPPYSDAVRKATGLPVYDAITACDYFISGMQDNKRFGANNWQKQWDGNQEAYSYGQNLNEQQRQELINPAKEPEAHV